MAEYTIKMIQDMKRVNSVNRYTEKTLNWKLLEMKNSVSEFKKYQWKTSPTEGLWRRQNFMAGR